MKRSMTGLLATFVVTASAAAQPAATPCPSGVASACASGAPSFKVQPASGDKAGFRVAIERRTVRGHAPEAVLPANDSARAEPQKADAALSLNPALKSDFPASRGGAQAGATVPARFIADRPPGAGLQSKSIADAQLSDGTRRRSAGWLDYFPEWHAGWALIIGLLVVALRRVPLRFRSNGL